MLDSRIMQIGSDITPFVNGLIASAAIGVFFASAMTMTGHGDTEDASYLALADSCHWAGDVSP